MNKLKIEVVGKYVVEIESKEHINDIELRARYIIEDIKNGKL
jgi:hypothetical protein